MELLSVEWEKNSKKPLYQQLYEHIKNEIIAGRLKFATRMPAKRKLEQILNISQTTIETAYEQLVAEGYLESIPRKGFFVCAREEFLYQPVKVKAKRKIKIQPKVAEYCFDFTPGKIDCSMFPFKVWRSLYREAISYENRHLLRHGDSFGEPELREEIKNYLYQSRGVNCSSDQIIIGAGIEYLLPQLLSLLGDNKIYGIEDPGYPLTRHVLESNDKKFIRVSVDAEGADIRELEKSRVNVMYVTPSHQFPLGCVMSANRRAKLLNWAHSTKSRYIIEDDYDSEFRYYGRTIPSLYSLGAGKKVIYLSTFSKSLMPSLRIGYMVLPQNLLKKYRSAFSCYASCVSRIDQYVLAAFMQSGNFIKHLNRMRTAYRKKVELIMNLLQPYRDKIKVSGEKAGLHLLLGIKSDKSESELVKLAKNARIKIAGLQDYYFKKDKFEADPSLILGFADFSEERLAKAIKELIACLKI
ncbi:MAG: PLP-dependent aminotransferase family protein [Candidatus Rifleibacteriota bacterium]